MIYEKRQPGSGEWHCPFPKEWVEMMKRAAKRCEKLTAEQIEGAYDREASNYQVPPGDFLSEPQDSRGLPLSWCEREEYNHRHWPDCCVVIYDYDSVPDIAVTNGEDDWPYNSRYMVLTA
jgi:hypothetical protein